MRGLFSPLQNCLLVKKAHKENLPMRICVVCERPYTWRRKWEKVWDEVKYCSDKCRMNRNKS